MNIFAVYFIGLFIGGMFALEWEPPKWYLAVFWPIALVKWLAKLFKKSMESL